MTTTSRLRSTMWLWLPGMVVMLVGLVASYGLWRQQLTSVGTIAQVRFTQEARSFAEALELRLAGHVEIIGGVRSLFTVNPSLSRADFERVVRDLDLPRQHPSIKNVQFTRYLPAAERAAFEARVRTDRTAEGAPFPGLAIHPAGEREEYFVVDYLWPPQGNEGVLGLDITSQPVNVQSLRYGRDTGQPIASPPFELYQERDFRTGFVIRTPVYAPPAANAAPGAPRRFLGSVGATVRVYDVVNLLRANGYLKNVNLQMVDIGGAMDGRAATPMPLLSLGAAFDTKQPVYERELQVIGRQWRLSFQPAGSFLSPSEQQLPWLLGGGGVIVTFLLTALITLLALRRAQAVVHANEADVALHDSEERFRTLFSQAAVGVAQTHTATGRMVSANRKFCEILGYTADELQNMTFQSISHPADLEADLALTRRVASGDLPEFRMEKRYFRKDGQIVWVDLSVSPMRTTAGPAQYHVAVVQDITARRQMEDALRNSELRLRGILHRLPVGVCLVQKGGAMMFRNERFLQICGYTESDAPSVEAWWRLAFPEPELRAQARADWLDAREHARDGDGTIAAREHVIHCKDGQRRAVEIAGVLVGEDHLVTMVDLSQRKAAEEEIRYLAFYDSLTRLPNRRLLLDRLQQALAVSARRQRSGAVLMLDLDNFKTLNETQGHEKGDTLLSEVAQRLRDCVHGDDTVARHGGDEFVVVLEDLGDNPQEAATRAEEMGQRILAALRPTYLLDGEAHHSTLSMGVTIFHDQRESVDELLKRAELAMYQAKAAGRNTLQFYEPQMQAAVAARVALESDMRAGLTAGQFELFYQPQMDYGQIHTAEALLRWRHPTRGFVSPAQFIPLAEESGLILQVGEWVLQAACERLAQWARHPAFAHLNLAVNVSPRQFHQVGFVPQVLAALASTGADGRRLKLELTEGLLLQDVEDTIAKMGQLRAYGVGFSLDDFGTGYSSLAYLKRLPLDELKIDQSFVRDVLTDPNDAAIARTIVALGTSLGLRVIAEGVETEAQRAFLERNHCHAWQGYLLSPPVSIDVFELLVQERIDTTVAPL